MNVIYRLLDIVRNEVRRQVRALATDLNRLTRGKLSPDMVTIIGLLAHLPIAYLIVQHHLYWAAALLVFFGLFDTLDGALAQVQQKASSAGMLLDASTDRFKEVILYTALAYQLTGTAHPRFAVWAVVACGASLCVSYVKAKGETAVKDSDLSPNEVNRLFQDGLMRFEVRMFILVLGLLTDRLVLALMVIAIASSLTAFGRLYTIRQRLRG